MATHTSGMSGKQASVRYFEGQFDDEDVLYVFRRHALVMRRGLVVSMSSWLIGPVVILILTYTRPNNPPSMAAFFLALVASIVVGSLLMLPSWVSWYFSLFIVTSQRFVQITQRGLFHSSFADMNLKQIQQVNYEIAGLQQTVLGFGTITLRTYMGELVIHDVPHPAKIQRKLVEILRDQGITATMPPFLQPQQLATMEAEEEAV
ncbi:MAG TPA: PH domain-containing protein [Candidatus Saccharimonadales bacterium]|nr:PH domain-containing protein [Candidatus Saccharimonadales bacterium]